MKNKIVQRLHALLNEIADKDPSYLCTYHANYICKLEGHCDNCLFCGKKNLDNGIKEIKDFINERLDIEEGIKND